MEKFHKGDTVQVTATATVRLRNDDGTYELFGVGGEGSADYVDESSLTLIKKATPKPPPIGSFIDYHGATYKRMSNGNFAVLNGDKFGMAILYWEEFFPFTAVRILTPVPFVS